MENTLSNRRKLWWSCTWPAFPTIQDFRIRTMSQKPPAYGKITMQIGTDVISVFTEQLVKSAEIITAMARASDMRLFSTIVSYCYSSRLWWRWSTQSLAVAAKRPLSTAGAISSARKPSTTTGKLSTTRQRSTTRKLSTTRQLSAGGVCSTTGKSPTTRAICRLSTAGLCTKRLSASRVGYS